MPHTDFPLSDVPRGETAMDPSLIKSLVQAGEPLEGAELADAVKEHERFVETGGAGSAWQTLEVAGMPLCMYAGGSDQGTQLVMRLKRIAAGASLWERWCSAR
jgi:hypothetical protein